MSALSLEQPVTDDRSLAARLENWLGLAIEIPAAALVVGEVVVLLAGVIMRFIFNNPIPWADELASILFLWLANLGAAVALRRGTHMRTTVLVGFMSERGKAWAEALAIIAPCVMLLILMHPMWEYAEDEMFVQTPALGWPNTVRAAAVAVGAALMIALSLLRISRQKLVDLAGVVALLAVVAGAMYLGAGWLQAIGNWNLVVFFGVVLGVSVLLGIPIAFCFGLATVAFMLTVTTSPLAVVAGRFDEGMSSLILLAVPLFILLGHLVEMTGMAKAMVDFLASLLGHVRGGLNYVLLGAMLLVSGISGAKTADMAAVAPVLLPEMKRRGNHEGELISLLAASGAMAETIPPSLVLITIGSVAGVSIAALFTGGIMPGIVLAVLLAILARWRSAEILEGIQRAPGRVVLRTLIIALPALLLPILIRTAVVEGVA
ncbi:TRAP transporter large permease subunit, partial [Herbaspirillum sp.]